MFSLKYWIYCGRLKRPTRTALPMMWPAIACQHLVAGSVGTEGKHRIQCVQLQRVVMIGIDRRIAGTHVPGRPAQALSLDGAVGELSVAGEAAVEPFGGSGDVEDHPVQNVVRVLLQSVIGIVHDEHEAHGSRRDVAEYQTAGKPASEPPEYTCRG